MTEAGAGGRIPIWLKLAYSSFFAVWFPVYWIYHGLPNFLWLCNIANFLILIGLWTESRLILSWQATGVLVIQLGWIVDLLVRLAFGFHPLSATVYMFEVSSPLPVRCLSLYHAVMPWLLVWSVERLGYDRRGFWLQCALTWIVLPISLLWFEERNLNSARTPEIPWLAFIPPGPWFAFILFAYPAVLFLPAHWLLLRWEHRT